MKVCQQDRKGSDIQWASKILEVVKSQGDEFAAREISELIQTYSERKINIAVVGLNKRGKSTFCNAWLGRKDDLLAPIGWKPATCTISKFYQSGERSNAEITYTQKNNSEIKCQIIPYERIRSFAQEEFNQANDKEVEYLSIYGQFDMDEDVVLLDLPGDDSIYAYHSQIVYNYLPHADVVLFLSSATDPVTSQELELLTKIKNDQKIFFIINKADVCEASELGEAISHNETVLQNAMISYVNRIYCISAKQVMETGNDNFDFQELIADIKSFLAEKKFELQGKGFRRLVKEAALPAKGELELKRNARNLGKQELQERISKLKEEYSRIEDILENKLQDFSVDWKTMLSDFEKKLPEIEGRSCQKVKEYIDSIPSMDFNEKTLKGLPGRISHLVESELAVGLGPMQEQIKCRLEQLEQNMKSVEAFFADRISGYLQPTTANNSFGGSILSGLGMVGLGGLLVKTAMLPAAVSSIPLVGPIFAAIGIAATSPLLVLGAPLFLGGTLVLTFPVVGWLKRKQMQKKEVLQQADNMVRQAFANMRNSKIDILRLQGERLVDHLEKSFTAKKQQVLSALEEIEKEKKDSENKNKLLQEKDDVSLQQLEDLTSTEVME